MKRVIMIISIISFSLTLSAHAWISEQVSEGDEVVSFYPSIAIDTTEDPGRAHVVWTEKPEPNNGTWVSYYRARNEANGWSYRHTLHEDTDGTNSIIRTNNHNKLQVPHIAFDESNDMVSAVFHHRNPNFYGGSETGIVFYRHDIQPNWTFQTYPEWMWHLHPVSGMAAHAKDAFIVPHPIDENFYVFWNHHQKMDDFDHDIYYNYRSTDQPTEITQWQFVKKASNSVQDILEFFQFVTVNRSAASGHYGDIYAVAADFGIYENGIFFTRYDYTAAAWSETGEIKDDTANPPWNTDDCIGCSIAHIYNTIEVRDELHVVYHYDYAEDRSILRYTVSYDLGVTWLEPVDLCYARQASSGEFQTYPRAVLDVDHNNKLYFVYTGMNEQVYVAKKSLGEDEWLHSNVVSNEKLHANAYLKVDPNENGHIQLVYDERTVEGDDEYWKIYWSTDGGRAQYVPYDWDNPW